MAITTYITTTEANYAYPNDANFSAGQRAQALTRSFGLVNSYVAAAVAVPVMSEWDGASSITAPEVLKVCQERFYRWCLESTSIDSDDDVQALYDSTAEILKGLTQDNLINPAQVTAYQKGWHIVDKTSGVNGRVEVRGGPADFHWGYLLTITTSGYPGTLVFSATRSDSATAVATGLVGYSTQWTTVDSRFEVRFDGQWSSGNTIRILGVPDTEVNKATPQGNVIRQGPVGYGAKTIAQA